MNLRPSLLAIACCVGVTACSAANNPFTGEVSATLGRHLVIVQECTTWHMPQVEDLPDGGQRFAPCKDSNVVIQGEHVSLNGNDVGTLQDQDTVIVKQGQVHIRSLRE